MDLNVRIEKNLPPIVPDAVSFETGLSKAQLEDSSVIGYEHHGPEFTTFDKGALSNFYEDLILGRPMPTVLATHQIQDIDTLFAIALFLHRDLATHPSTAGIVYTIDFVHRLGLPSLAHLDDSLARFFSALRYYFPEDLSQREVSDHLQNAVGWLREYVHNGTLALTGTPPRYDIRVLQLGTGGFVAAVDEGSGSLLDGWVELYRRGFLKGILSRRGAEDRNHVLITRKSLFLAFDLPKGCHILNQMEAAMGELPGWKVSVDKLWLESPEEGTLILLQHIMEVLVRI
jgi:hypothetical protein